jgi:hypothetical protein
VSEPSPAAPSASGVYSERLSVPLIWWFIPVFFHVVLSVGFHAYLGPTAAVGIMTVIIGATVWGLIAYGNVRVRVGADRFMAGSAWLPLTAVGAVYPLDAGQARALRGPRADARAHLVLRAYVPAAVRVDVDDANDRTPYWYVSTRHPQELAAALTAARDRARGNVKGGG